MKIVLKKLKQPDQKVSLDLLFDFPLHLNTDCASFDRPKDLLKRYLNKKTKAKLFDC